MSRAKVALLFLFGALLIVAAGALSGVIPLSNGHDSARPRWEQLPNKKSVVDAVTSHQDLVNRIQHVGAGVKVDVSTPYEDHPDRALVSIKYTTENEWKGVDAILRQEGFGVPAELISK